MTLKNRGNFRERRKEIVECQVCHSKNDINEDEVEHIENVRFIICEKCGNDIILRK